MNSNANLFSMKARFLVLFFGPILAVSLTEVKRVEWAQQDYSAQVSLKNMTNAAHESLRRLPYYTETVYCEFSSQTKAERDLFLCQLVQDGTITIPDKAKVCMIGANGTKIDNLETALYLVLRRNPNPIKLHIPVEAYQVLQERRGKAILTITQGRQSYHNPQLTLLSIPGPAVESLVARRGLVNVETFNLQRTKDTINTQRKDQGIKEEFFKRELDDLKEEIRQEVEWLNKGIAGLELKTGYSKMQLARYAVKVVGAIFKDELRRHIGGFTEEQLRAEEKELLKKNPYLKALRKNLVASGLMGANELFFTDEGTFSIKALEGGGEGATDGATEDAAGAGGAGVSFWYRLIKRVSGARPTREQLDKLDPTLFFLAANKMLANEIYKRIEDQKTIGLSEVRAINFSIADGFFCLRGIADFRFIKKGVELSNPLTIAQAVEELRKKIEWQLPEKFLGVTLNSDIQDMVAVLDSSELCSLDSNACLKAINNVLALSPLKRKITADLAKQGLTLEDLYEKHHPTERESVKRKLIETLGVKGSFSEDSLGALLSILTKISPECKFVNSEYKLVNSKDFMKEVRKWKQQKYAQAIDQSLTGSDIDTDIPTINMYPAHYPKKMMSGSLILSIAVYLLLTSLSLDPGLRLAIPLVVAAIFCNNYTYFEEYQDSVCSRIIYYFLVPATLIIMHYIGTLKTSHLVIAACIFAFLVSVCGPIVLNVNERKDHALMRELLIGYKQLSLMGREESVEEIRYRYNNAIKSYKVSCAPMGIIFFVVLSIVGLGGAFFFPNKNLTLILCSLIAACIQLILNSAYRMYLDKYCQN